MTGEVDFDALSRKVTESNGALEDLENLYGHAFALQQWHFIARGRFPDVRPYVASNAQVAGGQYMVRAFTDADRLQRFARENKLMETDAAGGEEVLILSLPTDKIVDYLEQFISQGVHGIWFNSDTKSDGFFVPLKQLRPIQEHLENLSRRPPLYDADVAIQPYDQPGQAPTEGAVAAPGDMLIPAGKPHRALCDIEVLVYDYDAMGVQTKVLTAGSIFQPWEPLEHWRGIKIPITLGEGATEFDWGVSSSEGHFLKWGDFFSRCQVNDAKTNDPSS